MPTVVELTRWTDIVLLSLILAVVSVSDIKHRRIPNWTVVSVTILFVPWIFAGGNVSILSSLAASLIAFLISCSLYVFRLVGAGDSKLLTAVALFVGVTQLPTFLMLVALAGGVIAIVSLAMQPTRTLVMFQMRGKGDPGRGVPYGVAIAIATICIVARPLLQNLVG